jgi:hypothetical protein
MHSAAIPMTSHNTEGKRAQDAVVAEIRELKKEEKSFFVALMSTVREERTVLFSL